jgi:hypothetical protein
MSTAGSMQCLKLFFSIRMRSIGQAFDITGIRFQGWGWKRKSSRPTRLHMLSTPKGPLYHKQRLLLQE